MNRQWWVRSARTCQKSPGLEEEMAHLWTQQHVLILRSKSCALHTPLLSVHPGGNLWCFHRLVPRMHSLHCHQQPPELRRQWCRQQIDKAGPHGALFLSIPSEGSLTSCKNAEEVRATRTLWTAIMRGCSAHLLWHLCLFMLVWSLILPVILPNCPSCWKVQSHEHQRPGEAVTTALSCPTSHHSRWPMPACSQAITKQETTLIF